MLPVKSLQLCPNFCYHLDHNLSGSSICGDSPGKNTGVGCRALFHRIFMTTGIEPVSLMSPALTDRFFTTSTTWEVQTNIGIRNHNKRDKTGMQ